MSRTKFALIVASAGLMLVGCSSPHHKAAATRNPPAVSAPPATTPASSPAATTAAAAAGLSGRWSGQYSGSYSGTFTLSWRQTGRKLSGSITLSAPAATLGLHGTVTSSGAIKFGTVGSLGITYTGSASGTSMSGAYHVGAGGAAGGGSWSASKKS